MSVETTKLVIGEQHSLEVQSLVTQTKATQSTWQAASQAFAPYFHLLVVYVVWGTTFFAIRIGVTGEGGFPPFLMAGLRVGAAGLLLVSWSIFRGSRFWTSPRQLCTSIAAGALIWAGGNGLVTYSEVRSESIYASLVFGTVPIWAASVGAFLKRQQFSARLCCSCILGMAGLAALTLPTANSGHGGLTSAPTLLLAAACWALGSVLNSLQFKDDERPAVAANAGLQQTVAGLLLIITSQVSGESPVWPSATASLALVYLIFVGSIIAFTSFHIAQRHLPNSIVMTHAFVNPIVATILGWLFLGEHVGVNTILAAAMVFLGVAAIFPPRKKKA